MSTPSKPDDAVNLGGDETIAPFANQNNNSPIPYDTRQSIKLKKVPATLDEMRLKDPQGAIDYLFARKEIYKGSYARQYQRANAAEAKLKEATKELESLRQEAEKNKERAAEKSKAVSAWKSRYQKELTMKKWWRAACCLVAVGLAVVVVVLITITQMMSMVAPRHGPDAPKVPVSGVTPKTPNHVLASVNIFNGDLQGSGTVISKGDEHALLLTAAHNFKGVIGGEFWVYYPDGTYTKGTLLAIDRKRDLALGRVDPKTIISRSYVPDKLNDGTLSGCGYTGGKGPNYRLLSYNSSYQNSDQKWLWDLSVIEGPFWDGDSGSGVFINEACVGVTSQRDAKVWTSSNSYYKKLYAVSHHEVSAFLRENTSTLTGCGDWSQPPEQHAVAGDQPPLWSPTPNVPINPPQSKDLVLKGLIEDVKRLKEAVGPQMKRPNEILPPPQKDKPPEMKRPGDIPDGPIKG